jgi:hypothetical protein
MSLRADVIVPNTSRSPYPSLFEGMLVTSVIAAAAGFGFVVVFRFNRGIVPDVLVLTIAAGMGLIAGFISRFELPKRSALIRWWVALFGLCVGMIPQGWLSGGVLGFDLISHASIKPDLEGLLRLSLGAISAWLAVRAWAGRSSARTSAIPQRRPLRGRNLRPTQMSSSVMEAPTITAPQRQSASTPSPRQSQSRRRSVSLGRPKSGSVVRKMRSIKRKHRRRIQSSIRLMESIEHRCPFCLELVERNDARGKVECRICHTLHHADCWAVTGTCQVPHHNS